METPECLIVQNLTTSMLLKVQLSQKEENLNSRLLVSVVMNERLTPASNIQAFILLRTQSMFCLRDPSFCTKKTETLHKIQYLKKLNVD